MKDKELRKLLGIDEIVEIRGLNTGLYEGFKEILSDIYNKIKNLEQKQDYIFKRLRDSENKNAKE